MWIPPKSQYIFVSVFRKLIDDEKLVDFESLIITKFFFLQIICCRYLSPVKFWIAILNKFVLRFNFFEISRTNDKFSLFDSVKKYWLIFFFKKNGFFFVSTGTILLLKLFDLSSFLIKKSFFFYKCYIIWWLIFY